MNEIFQRQETTLKDSRRLGRWDTLEVYLSDRERHRKTANASTLSFYLCNMETNKIPLATANDPERPPTTGSE